MKPNNFVKVMEDKYKPKPQEREQKEKDKEEEGSNCKNSKMEW